MSSQHSTLTPLETIQAVYDAFGRGDVDALFERIDPDVDWGTQVDARGSELVPMLANGRGHDAARHYFSGVTQLEFHRFEPLRFLVDAETVFVELSLDIEHRETGKRAQLGEIHRFVVRGGRIVHYRNFIDTATLIELHRP